MKNDWNRLDNAAKIFPAAAAKTDTQVFRISCELFDRINPAILQDALDDTIKVCHVYAAVLKRGMFWYYLESTELRAVVCEEHRQPCAPIYNKNKKTLLFEVTYFHNRVNLEVYHVLSDGSGAMHFLRMLITKYLSRLYGLEEPSLDFDASTMQMKDDSFQKYYTDSKNKKPDRRGDAFKLKGPKYSEDRIKAITGVVSVRALLDAAHSCNTTLTVFLCACLMDAIGAEMPARAKKNHVVLAIPVNLRKHFPSESLRNFFGVIFVAYHFLNRCGDFEDIAKKIGTDFKDGLTHENLVSNINTYSALEHNILARIIPRYIKDICLKIACALSARKVTARLSNLGVVTMPRELEKYIHSFQLLSGTGDLQVCVCSYQDSLSIGFTSPLISADIQRRFFRRLSGLGMEIELSSNPIDEE